MREPSTGMVQGAVATWRLSRVHHTRRQVATAPCTIPLLTQQSKIFCPTQRARPQAAPAGCAQVVFRARARLGAVKDRKDRRAAARHENAACANLLQPSRSEEH